MLPKHATGPRYFLFDPFGRTRLAPLVIEALTVSHIDVPGPPVHLPIERGQRMHRPGMRGDSRPRPFPRIRIGDGETALRESRSRRRRSRITLKSGQFVNLRGSGRVTAQLWRPVSAVTDLTSMNAVAGGSASSADRPPRASCLDREGSVVRRLKSFPYQGAIHRFGRRMDGLLVVQGTGRPSGHCVGMRVRSR